MVQSATPQPLPEYCTIYKHEHTIKHTTQVHILKLAHMQTRTYAPIRPPTQSPLSTLTKIHTHTLATPPGSLRNRGYFKL
mmetsp:Transcript_91880/g.134278  ORF Transcript_91880/g.134278 Transcript_91880/m.134278 type:complete len:80 (-) Transcript_91880:66-305(-)